MSKSVTTEIMERGFGSLIGAGIGFALLRGPAGAVLGSLAGYALQQKLRRWRTGGDPSIGPVEVHQRVSHLIRLLAAIARVDGPVTARRRAAIRS